MMPLDFLAKLQAEAVADAKTDKKKSGDFHHGLHAWVDDNSGIAKALRKMAEDG